jgi:hypothetical protein
LIDFLSGFFRRTPYTDWLKQPQAVCPAPPSLLRHGGQKGRADIKAKEPFLVATLKAAGKSPTKVNSLIHIKKK